MAKQETRFITVHKEEKYDRFTQVGFNNLGAAMGILDSVGGKNLYLYLVSNANNMEFELKVANYANWLNDPIYREDGTKNDNKSAKYRKQINSGIDQLVEKGYLVQRYPAVYDFYEGGIVTGSSNCNKNDQLEQIVTDETNGYDCNQKLQMKQKVTVLKPAVTNETKKDNCNDLLQMEQSVPIYFEF